MGCRFHAIELYDKQNIQEEVSEKDAAELQQSVTKTWIWAIALFGILCIGWPLLALPAGSPLCYS